MAILYAFDEHKNKVAFDGNTGTPVTVPMQLSDGSILFYDRGSAYGEYSVIGSDIVRIYGGVDDGSAESLNWRYLICEKQDFVANRNKEWGPYGTSEGLTGIAIGVGLPNTEAMIAKYGDNNTYLWKLIKEKRDSTGFDWFIPSKDELNMMYNNRTAITGQGGDAFETGYNYWSSSEYDIYTVWCQVLSSGFQNDISKSFTYPCRLFRRI